MVSVSDLQRWDPGGVDDVFARYGLVRDELLDLDDSLGAARPPETWQGPAADAARAEHERLAEGLRRVVAGATAARPTLADTVDAITAIRADLTDVIRRAGTAGLSIAPDGAVGDTRTVTLPADQVTAYQAQRRAEMTTIADAVRGVLTRADRIDATLADVLARAVAGQVDDGTYTTLAGAASNAVGETVPPAPPPGGRPADNHAWWAGLTAVQQEAVLVQHPDWVGDLDGIPAAVRDEANRAQLPDEVAAIDAQLAAARQEQSALRQEQQYEGGDHLGMTPEQVDNQAVVDRLQRQHDAATAISAAITGPDRQLLLLDIDGHAAPRAAVAVGDVDTADHVAVFTPGLTTTVERDLGSYTADMAGVRQTAQQQLRQAGHGDQTVATVAWLGYDAPQWSTTFEGDRSVAGSADAQHGGADLARFYQGVNDSRPAHDPHLTALGHSYGSTTTGYALQHPGTGVDDVVLFGSPGPGTGTISDLQVAPGHVGVLEARDDPVADLGRFGGDTNQMPGVTDLSSRPQAADGNHPALTEATGHSAYLAPGTTSQWNISATVAGLPDIRCVGPNSGLGDLIRAAGDI